MFPVPGWARDPGSNKRGIMCEVEEEKQHIQNINITSTTVTREDLLVTSKLWNTDHSAEHVEAACRRSLADLQLEYLDLYLIHFPIRCTQ